MDSINKVIRYLRQDKKRIYLLIIAAFALLVTVIASFSQEQKTYEENSLSEYKAELEEELSKLCSSVKGAGKCVVNVTFAEGERIEYKGNNISASYPPKVLGVAVICEGAGKESVKADITECITSLFDIGANRVSVLRLK